MKQAVFDIEANALELKDVTKVWCIVIQDLSTLEVFKYGPEQILSGLDKLRSFDRIIGHNIINYDLPVLGRLHGFVFSGQVIDTLVLSRLANPDRRMPWGMPGPWIPHSIEAWGRRLGQHKVEWDKWDAWDEGMMERCAKDVLINTEVYKALYYEFKE